MSNNEEHLQHWGIKGMRWGVRRKRGPDGRVESTDSKTAKTLKKKHISEMSNDELKKLNTRLQLERQYKDLSKKDTSAGKQFISQVLRESGKNIASKYVQNAGEMAIANVAKALTKSEPSPGVKEFRSTGYSTSG